MVRLAIDPRTERRFKTWYRRKLRFLILHRDGFCCRYCGRSIEEGARLTVDHVVPKSRAGGFCWNNLCAACSDCNEGKADVLLQELEIKEPFICPANIV
jgi:5-methylcytosine-specific restriction endonuclease McrA